MFKNREKTEEQSDYVNIEAADVPPIVARSKYYKQCFIE